MNGVELLNWCRNEEIYLPVIFITANLELLPDEKLALKDCCSALMQKPIDFDELLLAIESAKKRNHDRDCPF
jgi:DNA-binding response OmpR family regulator